jgi:hypothetical protein
MRHTFNNTLILLLLLLLLPGVKAAAQESYSFDWELSQLRGSWEYHTFRDKWTLVFECDHKMLFDREPADYTLVPGAIRVQDGTGSTDYPYRISSEGLTLTLPDGSNRTYRNTSPGEAEKAVFGTMYSSLNGSSAREDISFDGDHLFVLQAGTGLAGTDGHDGVVERKGVYRVEGDVVVLTFDDSTILEAKVHFRDDDGSITSVMLNDRLFATQDPVATSTPAAPVQIPSAYSAPPPVILVPVYIPEAPPAYSISTVPPPGAGTPAVSDKKAEKPKEQKRDFGTTRGKGDGR